ncbi:MAG: glycosyltransferase [Patescibacteria group bacterium]|nr:glycosyltransferase [Patescibacteria group bacterium]
MADSTKTLENTMMTQRKIAIVIPVYEDVPAFRRLLDELSQLVPDKIFVIAVDDGSINHPLESKLFENLGLGGVILRLRRNVGHQHAIAIGLSYVVENVRSADAVVIMDSDGEDDPGAIPLLLEALKLDSTDVVVAKRKKRVESLKFRFFYKVYKMLFKFTTGQTINFGNFMALKLHAVQRLTTMPELCYHVAAAILASKLRVQSIPIDRRERYAGKSKMNFISLVLHGFRALMVFSENVMVRIGIACSLMGAAALISMLMAIFLKISGYSTPGWFSVAFGLLLLIFIQTGTLAFVSLLLAGHTRSYGLMPIESYKSFVQKVFIIKKTNKPKKG